MSSGPRALDFGGRDRNSISILKWLIRRTGLAIDPYQIFPWLLGADLLLKQLGDGRTVGYFEIVGKAATIVVDLC